MLESRASRSLVMITFRVSTDVKDDHRVELTLPPEVPTGKADLVVSVSSVAGVETKRSRTSLAEWADEQAEHWGDRLSAADVEGFAGRRF
jgi:hypothetical protein